MSLKGKIALVTGAGQGIGLAIAEALGEAGAAIVVCDIAKDKADSAAEGIKRYGVEAISFAVNVANLSEVENMADTVFKKYGKIDILVNNAGITRDNLMLRMDKAEWDSVIDVNLTGVFNCTKSVSKYMIKGRYGKIINITSIIGVAGNAGQVNYSASKAGIIGLTKSAAKELSMRNINVNAVAPGFIDTDMTRVLKDTVKEEMMKQIPFKRFGTVQDIANAVVFLASEDSSYITGQVINVNGGMYM